MVALLKTFADAKRQYSYVFGMKYDVTPAYPSRYRRYIELR